MSISADPLALFQHYFSQAQQLPLSDATAACLATSSKKDGTNSVRMVLVKAIDEKGFVFYTNFHSQKAQEIKHNPHASLCFYWEALGKQIRIEGVIEKVSDTQADTYFASRSRLSQLGAWVSKQSSPLPTQERLLEEFALVEKKFEGISIPRPPHWGGFRLMPVRMEFWTQGAGRLHERLVYTRASPRHAAWQHSWLYP